MAFKIKGFGAVEEEQSEVMLPLVSQTTPCKCLVQVYFPHSNQTLTYFNDQFNLKDGDIVFVRSCDTLENGEIGVVVIGDEATLKRVYYDRAGQKLVLSPENPRYAPLVFTGEELATVKILGRAVAFQSRLV